MPECVTQKLLFYHATEIGSVANAMIACADQP